MGYSVVRIEEIEPAGPGGAVRFVRRRLGVEAFGLNWFELPPDAEPPGPPSADEPPVPPVPPDAGPTMTICTSSTAWR